MMVLDREKVLDSLGGDEALFSDVMGILVRELPRHMVSLGEAITRGDGEAIELLAHSIKGEVGYLSLAEVSQHALEMEASGREGDLTRAAALYPGLQMGVARLLPVCAGWLEQ